MASNWREGFWQWRLICAYVDADGGMRFKDVLGEKKGRLKSGKRMLHASVSVWEGIILGPHTGLFCRMSISSYQAASMYSSRIESS